MEPSMDLQKAELAQMEKDAEALVIGIEKAAIARNIMSEAEFKRFIPLFNKSKCEGFDPMQIQDLGTLSEEWISLIDIYTPVRIVDAEGNVKFTLPPMFSRVGDIITAHTHAPMILQNFLTSIQHESEYSTDGATATNNMISTIDLVQQQNAKALLEGNREYHELTDNLRHLADVDESPISDDGDDSNVSGMAWT